MIGRGNPFPKWTFTYGKKTVSMRVHITGCKTKFRELFRIPEREPRKYFPIIPLPTIGPYGKNIMLRKKGKVYTFSGNFIKTIPMKMVSETSI